MLKLLINVHLLYGIYRFFVKPLLIGSPSSYDRPPAARQQPKEDSPAPQTPPKDKDGEYIDYEEVK